jgi:hypothetical protein
MLNDSGRDNFLPERVPRRLLAGVVCSALAGVVCSALVAWLPGSSGLGSVLFGRDAETGRDPGAGTVHAAAVAPPVVPSAVSATVGPADAPMPRAGRAVDVKDVVLGAYQSALSLAPASCGLDVSLLAAIGQVESGNLTGYRLDADHRADPPVLGPVLDGSNGLTAVPDTDGGEWDGETTWDRAMGPLQFIPNAWRLAGFDFDTDGERDPQDIEDAAGAAMVFLCAGGDDLSARSGLRNAVLAFNPEPSYVRLVLAWKAAFADQGLDLAEAEQPAFTAAQYTRISRDVAISTARTADALAPSGPEATPDQDPSGPGGPGPDDGAGPSAGPNPDAPGTPPRPGAAPPVVPPAEGGGPPGASPLPPPPGSAEPSPGEPAPAPPSDPPPTDPPSDPAPSEPAPSEPAPSDPAPSDPAPSDPAPSDPWPSEPAPSEPAPSEPAPSDPAPSDPAPSEPAPSEPAPSEPAPSEPAPSDPAPSEPAPSDPAPSEPSGPAQPSAPAFAW